MCSSTDVVGLCCCRLTAWSDFGLVVDVPFPFSLTPTPALEAAGNAASQRILDELMDVLGRAVVKDHRRWAKAQAHAKEHVLATS